MSAGDDVVLQRTLSDSEDLIVIPHMLPVNTDSSGPKRGTRNLETSVIGGHLFSLLPALEGKWSGEAQRLDGTQHSSSIKIAYVDEECVWEVRTTVADTSGVAVVQSIRLSPTGHGTCQLTASSESRKGVTSYDERCGDLFATITERCLVTGALERMEVWSLQTSTGCEPRLTRTISVYHGGDLVSYVVCRERKVS
eukprot:TRINITY_DN4150_c0_g1_i1.p1 TRINITY_DN4150_c0_g1~~TRINITY_DN4150_c0_g1_i1.p1  ORF type:complete len:217 (-),score=27.40 TRINITY_DN4150_c0_g1_i1:402-989(-)